MLREREGERERGYAFIEIGHQWKMECPINFFSLLSIEADLLLG